MRKRPSRRRTKTGCASGGDWKCEPDDLQQRRALLPRVCAGSEGWSAGQIQSVSDLVSNAIIPYMFSTECSKWHTVEIQWITLQSPIQQLCFSHINVFTLTIITFTYIHSISQQCTPACVTYSKVHFIVMLALFLV